MMKKLYTFLFVLLFVGGAMGQGCLPNGITFGSQTQIDSFQINYPGCTEIGGDLIFNGGDIENLENLNVLTSVGGCLWIIYIENLVSLNGLNNINSIGSYLSIDGNNNLTDISALENINAESITELLIINNYNLSTCHIKSVCERIAISTENVSIGFNAFGPGSHCKSVLEVEEACESVSIDDPNNLNVATIYPNPTNSVLTIELPTQPSQNKILTISNTNGQQLLTHRIAKPQTDIDISHLPVGIYIVKVWSDKDVVVRKIIKQ